MKTPKQIKEAQRKKCRDHTVEKLFDTEHHDARFLIANIIDSTPLV